jgi:ABC-2 type transport system permease protein
MDLTAPGDVLFGLGVFGLAVHPSAQQWLLFLVFSLTTACIMTAFTILAHSLAFWLGNAQGLAAQLWNAFTSFATYPTVIFHGPVKLLLFTVIPAGFIAYVPVRVIQRFAWAPLLAVVAFATALLTIATLVFAAGLRRYESGNLMIMRA